MPGLGVGFDLDASVRLPEHSIDGDELIGAGDLLRCKLVGVLFERAGEACRQPAQVTRGRERGGAEEGATFKHLDRGLRRLALRRAAYADEVLQTTTDDEERNHMLSNSLPDDRATRARWVTRAIAML
jgi:hypothetical protein